MAISFTCPSCGTTTQVDESYAGQSGPCVSCGKTVTVPGPAVASPAAKQSSGANTLIVVLGVLALCGFLCAGGLAAMIYPMFGQASEAAKRAQCTNNLKQIAIAMHNYHNIYGTFPPAYIPGEDGTPMHSWRVLILPFMEDGYLHDQYDFNEPWDSPNNFALSGYTPGYYTCPSDPTASCSYFVINVPNGLFDGSNGGKIQEAIDGTSNTIMVVEVLGSNVNWMEPTDLGPSALAGQINSTQNGTVISSAHPGGAMVAFGDGSVQFLPQSTTLNVLQNLTTKNDGNPVQRP